MNIQHPTRHSRQLVPYPAPRRRTGAVVAAAIGAAALVLAAVYVAFGRPATADTVHLNELSSTYMTLVEAPDGRRVQGRNADARMHPASLTKIMTAVVALERIDSLDATLRMPEDAFDMLAESNASVAGLYPGETASAKDMLYGLLLPSGADCALAIARYVAGGEQAFAELMNATAARIGMTGTHFTNATGLDDDDHYSTANDIATLMLYALRNETFAAIIGTERHEMRTASMHDGLVVTSTLFDVLGDPAVGSGVITGGKTGYTEQAGRCLATVARFGLRTYVLVTAGAPGDHATRRLDIDDARYVYRQIGW